MLDSLLAASIATWRFRSYEPRRVTPARVIRWLRQFPSKDRPLIIELLRHVVYLSEQEMRRGLVRQNAALIERLRLEGIEPKHLIYASIGGAGTSSPVTLGLLRNDGLLERLQCRIIDASNATALSEATKQLRSGAIIYVDDFIGSGDQFTRDRGFVASHILGEFVEFVLAGCVCEEGLGALGRAGVEAITQLVHTRTDRPLHLQSTLMNAESREALTRLCRDIDGKGGLGYHDMATMVVNQRNTPNGVPLVFRGNKGQQPVFGLIPRTTDLFR